MIKMEKLLVIAKAKFSDKSKLGDWYTTRLEICEKCPLNSMNTPASNLKERAWVIANIGKPTCLGCGCEIAAKASVRGETCGAKLRGLEPLWGPLPEMAEIDMNGITITNLNTDKIKVVTDGRGIIVDYGAVPHGFDSYSEIELKSDKGPIDRIKVVPGCGCTSSTNRIENGKAIFSLAYDTVGRQGSVTKTFTVYYTVNGKKIVLMGKLLINVLNKKINQ